MTFSIGACTACDARAPLFDALCIRCAVVRVHRRRVRHREMARRFGEPIVVVRDAVVVYLN